MDGLLSGSNHNNIPTICADTSGGSNANTNHNVVITAANVINSCNQYVNSLSNMPICTTSSFSATTTTTTTNITTSEDTEMRHRFRVVKLVSSQPYTRGRWTCFDYNDENQNTINIAKHAPANKILANGHPENSQLNDHNCNTTNNNTGSDQSEVAIDNKIEQAMDLVKSHLMFAVREEVDVLRERIKELENDNQILIAHASPETLALLSNRSTSTNPNID